MVYYTSIILLAKPFLPKRSARSRTHTIPSPMIDEATTRAASLCMEAARDICLLGKRYREAFGSFRRSPLTATHCTLSAALMILCNLGGGKSHNADIDLVESCLVTLSELSDSWMPTQRYCRSFMRVVRDRQRSGSGDSKIPASSRPYVSSSTDTDGRVESSSNCPSDITQDASQLALSYPWVEDSSLLGMAAEDLDFASLFPSGSAFTHDEVMMFNLNMPLDLDSTMLTMVDNNLGDVNDDHSHLHNRI
ncbi:hypothetical protein N7475_007241 [Penicillium sp. IBT 31633x]|nr:hypothetical protein N7475_007241 [Penicillium sp. IBT 31633x]